MFKEFRAFIARGNVLDLAVAVIVGGAFTKIVTSLTDDVLMPIVGTLFGSLDFSGYFIRMGPIPAGYAGSLRDYAALKKAGVPMIGYGAFLTQLADFLVIAFFIFLLVRAVNRATALFEHERRKAAAEPSVEPTDIALLREIRDELRARPPA